MGPGRSDLEKYRNFKNILVLHSFYCYDKVKCILTTNGLSTYLLIQHRMSDVNKDQVSNINKRNGLNKKSNGYHDPASYLETHWEWRRHWQNEKHKTHLNWATTNTFQPVVANPWVPNLKFFFQTIWKHIILLSF